MNFGNTGKPGARRRQRRRVSFLRGIGPLVLIGLVAGCSSSAGHDQAVKPAGPNASSSTVSGTKSAPTTPDGPAVKVDISPAASAHANPVTPVVIKAADGTLQSVSMTNPKGLAVTGTYAADKASWKTSEVLGYGKTYKISVKATDAKGKVLTKTSSVTTMNPPTSYPSVVPPPQATDIGVGMPLAVRFGAPMKSVADRAAVQKMLTVTSNPVQQGAWYWLSPTEVDYRPATYWKAHSKLTLNIKIYGKDLGGGIYGQTDRTINYTVHDSWVAKADGNSHQMNIYQNGQLVKTMPISMGSTTNDTPTHLGTHVISAKDREYTMNSCSYGVCSGPNSYISKEYYAERISDDGEFVHENPNSVLHQGNSNVSHGCINLNEANAQWFFAHLGVGDVVEVTNSGGPPLPIGDRIGVWAVQWPTWQAGNAIS